MLFDLIFPKYCLECRTKGQFICENCLKKVHKAYTKCPVCHEFSFQGKTHPSCQARFELDRHISIFRYEGVIRKAILGLKYKFASEIATELSEIIVSETKKLNLFRCGDILIPVPLHTGRERWRGFNQAGILGKNIVDKLDLTYEPNLLFRVKNVTPQVHLDKEHRVRNIKGVYEIRGNIIEDKRYLIFDDVWTTGSTIKEAGKVLKKAGASEVWGVTVAS